jgi:ribosomal protein S18 acetylase RimI-like enzyme
MQSHGLIIREARPQEVEAVLGLWRQAGATASVTDTAEDLRRAVASSACLLVAEADGRLAGTLLAAFDGWRGSFYRLAVHPDYRRQGIARALVSAGEGRLAERGARRINALVEKDHPGAMAFWAAAGYDLDLRLLRFNRNLQHDPQP